MSVDVPKPRGREPPGPGSGALFAGVLPAALEARRAEIAAARSGSDCDRSRSRRRTPRRPSSGGATAPRWRRASRPTPRAACSGASTARPWATSCGTRRPDGLLLGGRARRRSRRPGRPARLVAGPAGRTRRPTDSYTRKRGSPRADGSPLDLARPFTPDDDPARDEPLPPRGGLPAPARPVCEGPHAADLGRHGSAAADYSDGDGRSWWVKTKDGERRLVRMQGFDAMSEDDGRAARGSGLRPHRGDHRRRPPTRRSRGQPHRGALQADRRRRGHLRRARGTRTAPSAGTATTARISPRAYR